MRLDVRVACFYMHAWRVVSRFDAKADQELSGYDLYESLLTYVAHMDLVGVPLQDRRAEKHRQCRLAMISGQVGLQGQTSNE